MNSDKCALSRTRVRHSKLDFPERRPLSRRSLNHASVATDAKTPVSLAQRRARPRKGEDKNENQGGKPRCVTIRKIDFKSTLRRRMSTARVDANSREGVARDRGKR